MGPSNSLCLAVLTKRGTIEHGLLIPPDAQSCFSIYSTTSTPITASVCGRDFDDYAPFVSPGFSVHADSPYFHQHLQHHRPGCRKVSEYQKSQHRGGSCRWSQLNFEYFDVSPWMIFLIRQVWDSISRDYKLWKLWRKKWRLHWRSTEIRKLFSKITPSRPL